MSFLHHRVKIVKAQAAVRKASQKEERANAPLLPARLAEMLGKIGNINYYSVTGDGCVVLFIGHWRN